MTSPQSVADCAAVGGAFTPLLNLMDDKARPLRDNSGVANPSSPASHDRPLLLDHPNGHKITMFLEEAKLKYRVIPVNIGKGEQFDPAFLKISPNNRIPRWWTTSRCSPNQLVSVARRRRTLRHFRERRHAALPRRQIEEIS